jgi:hypothetical protein
MITRKVDFSGHFLYSLHDDPGGLELASKLRKIPPDVQDWQLKKKRDRYAHLAHLAAIGVCVALAGLIWMIIAEITKFDILVIYGFELEILGFSIMLLALFLMYICGAQD